MIVFDVNGVPVPQPRHRMRLLAGRNGAMHSYMAPSNHRIYGWRSRVALEARKHRPPQPWCGPVRVVLAFRIPAPQRVLRQRREEGGISNVWAVSKGDIDNYVKAVLDVLTDEGFWVDDSQVVSLQAAKVWVNNRQLAGCMVTVDYLCEGPKETHND